MKYSAALDLSGKFAGFALAKEGKILLSEYKAMRGRSSAGLSSWMLELMRRADVKPAQIEKWTVGSGPGSFTGMRLAAALVEGITLGKDGVRTRCVPGAVTLGGAVETAENDKIAAVFDGRNKEILLFELIRKNNEFQPASKIEVLDQGQAQKFFTDNNYSNIVALDYESANIEAVMPPQAFAEIHWVKHLSLEKLIQCEYKEFDNDLTALVYIRPAVFS